MQASEYVAGGIYLDARSQVVKGVSPSPTKGGSRGKPAAFVAVLYVTGEGGRAGKYGVKNLKNLSPLPSGIAGSGASL
jgi:hypothetical protein